MSKFTNEGSVFSMVTDTGSKIARIGIAHQKYINQDLGISYSPKEIPFLAQNIHLHKLYNTMFGRKNWKVKIVDDERGYQEFRIHQPGKSFRSLSYANIWYDKEGEGLNVNGHRFGIQYTLLPYIK